MDTIQTNETQETREAFCINSEERANWYAKKLATIEAERARIKAQAAQMLAQLDADETRLRYLFEDQAREWARAEIARRGGRRRSLTLLQGTFAFRTVPPSVRIDDPAAALSHAAELGAVKVDTAAYRAAAVDAFKIAGEILPVCVLDGEREHFAIRFGQGNGGEATEPR